MPLIKHKPESVTENPQDHPASSQPPIENVLAEKAFEPETKPYTGRKADSHMSKEDYWRRKDERDLAKDPSIRLSGVLQALLGSVNFGQYCTGTTSDEYLDKIEMASLRLSKFIKEKAQ